METMCKFPECLRVSAVVERKEREFCFEHWRLYQGWKKKTLREETVPESIALQIFLSTEGMHVELASKMLTLDPKAIRRAVKEGRFEVEADPLHSRRKILHRRELTRLAQLKFGWISTAELSDLARVNRSQFRRYAIDGHFGPTLTNIYGSQCVRVELRQCLARIRVRFKELAAQYKRNSNDFHQKVTAENEFTPVEIASMMTDIGVKAVLYWCRQGYLPHRNVGKFIVITKADLLRFIDEYRECKWLRSYTKNQLVLLHNKLTAK